MTRGNTFLINIEIMTRWDFFFNEYLNFDTLNFT